MASLLILMVMNSFRPDLMPRKTIPTAITGNHYDIQKAIDDCFKKGGGTVYIPEGVYGLEETFYGKVSKYFYAAFALIFGLWWIGVAVESVIKVLKN